MTASRRTGANQGPLGSSSRLARAGYKYWAVLICLSAQAFAMEAIHHDNPPATGRDGQAFYCLADHRCGAVPDRTAFLLTTGASFGSPTCQTARFSKIFALIAFAA